MDNKVFYSQLKKICCANCIAAVSLATRVSFVLHLFTGSFAGGAGIICAQYWGKRDEKTIQKIFGLIVRYMVGVYLIISMDEVIKLPWVYHHYKRYIWVKDITRDDL